MPVQQYRLGGNVVALNFVVRGDSETDGRGEEQEKEEQWQVTNDQ